MFYGFGIFLDYHQHYSGRIIKRRIPSDALYLFQNPPADFTFVDETWQSRLEANSDLSSSNRSVISSLLSALEKHTVRTEII